MQKGMSPHKAHFSHQTFHVFQHMNDCKEDSFFCWYFNISVETVLHSESVILLTKNGHVAYNDTKMCMWGLRGSLKNLVPLYNYTTPILTPSHTHRIQCQPLNWQKAHIHPLVLIFIQKYLFSTFIIPQSQIVGNVVVFTYYPVK